MKKPEWPPAADRIAVFKALLKGPKTHREIRAIAGEAGATVILARMQQEGLLRKRGAFDSFELAPKVVAQRLREGGADLGLFGCGG